MRIPYDSVCLAAVVAEVRPLIGAQLQRIVQVDPLTVALGFYAAGEHRLLLSADAQFARAHLVSKRPEGIKPPPPFCADLRRVLTDSRLLMVRQRGLDRVIELGFGTSQGDFMLIGELMGKHSNLILVDGGGKVVAAAKRVGPSKSRRPVLPGKAYEPPPFEPRPSFLDAREGDDLSAFEGVSPFLKKLLAAGMPLREVQDAVREGRFAPVFSPEHGAYPLSVAALGLPEVARESIGGALEQHFDSLVAATRLESARSSLLGQLGRVLSARQLAERDLEGALEAAAKAGDQQERAQLILAYQSMVQPGDSELEAWDYAGEPVRIPLDPELNPVENANRLFEKAKKAKAHQGEVAEQLERLRQDRIEIERRIATLETAETIGQVEEVRAEADRRRWLHAQRPGLAKEERPYEGKRVRELLSPGGWRVLYGENSEANDYLTMRVARPNDWWLHVRGATSAHVVLVTGGKPEKVQTPDLLFAAQVAVRNSPSKHSGLVAVDYTLRKYVRKPRGSASGFALYVREKTLHVEGGV